MSKHLPWLSLIFVCLVVTIYSSQDDFTCVAGVFNAGQVGNVTCYFGPNIYDTGYHFEIVRYPYNASPSHSGEDVLRCHRLGRELKCTTGAGFEFNEEIKPNLTVIIPKVSKDQEGRYACQLIPPDNRKKRLCELTVEEVPVWQNIRRHETNIETVWVLAVFVVVLPLLCGGIILYMICRKNRRKLTEFFFPKQRARYGRAAELHTNTRYHLLPFEKQQFPGDEEDAKKNGKRPYKVDIDLNYEVEDKRRFEDSEGYRRKYNDDAEERVTPYKVDIALDYEVAGKTEKEGEMATTDGYKRKYNRHDAVREEGYKVDISLDYKVEGKDDTDEGYKPRRYDGDSEDEKREPLKFTLPPQHQWGDVQITETVPKGQPQAQQSAVHRDVIRLPTRRL